MPKQRKSLKAEDKMTTDQTSRRDILLMKFARWKTSSKTNKEKKESTQAHPRAYRTHGLKRPTIMITTSMSKRQSKQQGKTDLTNDTYYNI